MLIAPSSEEMIGSVVPNHFATAASHELLLPSGARPVLRWHPVRYITMYNDYAKTLDDLRQTDMLRSLAPMSRCQGGRSAPVQPTATAA